MERREEGRKRKKKWKNLMGGEGGKGRWRERLVREDSIRKKARGRGRGHGRRGKEGEGMVLWRFHGRWE